MRSYHYLRGGDMILVIPGVYTAQMEAELYESRQPIPGGADPGPLVPGRAWHPRIDDEVTFVKDVLSRYVSVELHLEFITHDGYDENGPVSNIYNLYVHYRYDHTDYVDLWSWEHWYLHQPTYPSDGYEFSRTYTVNQFHQRCATDEDALAFWRSMTLIDTVSYP